MYKYFEQKGTVYTSRLINYWNLGSAIGFGIVAICLFFFFRNSQYPYWAFALIPAIINTILYIHIAEIDMVNNTVTTSFMGTYKTTYSLDSFINFEIVHHKAWGIAGDGRDINMLFEINGHETSLTIFRRMYGKKKVSAIIDEIKQIITINTHSKTTEPQSFESQPKKQKTMCENITLSDLESKEKLKEILDKLLAGLNTQEPEQYDWYCMLFPEIENYDYNKYRGSEHIIAAMAIKHPELHNTMVEIVEKVTDIANEIGEVWNDEEDHAASNFARELSIADKKHIPLYARYLATNDLNHEVYQSEDLWDILSKWPDWDKYTYPIVVTRVFTPGQHGREDWIGFYEGGLGKALKKDSETDIFFDIVKQFFEEEWGLDYEHAVRFNHFEEFAQIIYPDDKDKSKALTDRFNNLFEK